VVVMVVLVEVVGVVEMVVKLANVRKVVEGSAYSNE